MKKIDDDFLKSIMSDSARIIKNQESVIKEEQVVNKPTSHGSSSTKKYLIEQIAQMEQQLFHIKSILERMA
jgi:DNA-binding ferritin-like protein